MCIPEEAPGSDLSITVGAHSFLSFTSLISSKEASKENSGGSQAAAR